MSDSFATNYESCGAVALGCVVGGAAAFTLHALIGSLEAAIAAFVILGYTTWLWRITASEIAVDREIREDLRQLQINRRGKRFARLLVDVSFWWSLLFGCTITTSSLWYAGVSELWQLALIVIGWSTLATLLNYGLTLLAPTTRCRRCAYELFAQLATAGHQAKVRCSECGAKWTRDDLGLSEEAWEVFPHRSAAALRA